MEWSFIELKRNYDQGKATLINRLVGSKQYGVQGENLSEILLDHGVNPSKVTFVSIDVDGAGLEIFLAMGFKPPVAVMKVETNVNPKLNLTISLEIAHKHY